MNQPIGPATAYALEKIAEKNPEFAQRVEGAYRAMQVMKPANVTAIKQRKKS